MSGIKSQLMHGMMEDEKRMCDKGLQDFQYSGEEMPDINVFFKHQRDGWLPSDAHQKLTLNNITGFKDHGCKVPTLEMSPEAWMRIHPILSRMYVTGTLKKLLGKRADASQIESGKQAVCVSNLTSGGGLLAQLRDINRRAAASAT